MIITEKDKLKKLKIIAPIIRVSNVDLFKRVVEEYPEREELPPFDDIAGIKIENGLNISFEDLTLFADSKTEDELITSTAKVYLKLTDKKKIDNLPMLKFLRLMEYAKDITIYANKLFSTMKREYTKEEKEAGIENIKSDDFDLIDAFCKRNGIQNRDDGYKEHWIVIYRCLKRDFDMAEFNRRYAEVIEHKYKKK